MKPPARDYHGILITGFLKGNCNTCGFRDIEYNQHTKTRIWRCKLGLMRPATFTEAINIMSEFSLSKICPYNSYRTYINTLMRDMANGEEI